MRINSFFILKYNNFTSDSHINAAKVELMCEMIGETKNRKMSYFISQCSYIIRDVIIFYLHLTSDFLTKTCLQYPALLC